MFVLQAWFKRFGLVTRGQVPRWCFYIFSSICLFPCQFHKITPFFIMHCTSLFLFAAGTALAARPFLNEPDTGIDDALGTYASTKTLPPLPSIVALPDFDWAARQVMNTSSYTYYRNGAGGEWSYRNNLESYSRFRLRPRTLVDITGIESTLKYATSPPIRPSTYGCQELVALSIQRYAPMTCPKTNIMPAQQS
jgi:hypothetical protein